MNTLLAVFALLCAVGSVFCGLPERSIRPIDPELPGPIRPIDPELPGPIRPIDPELPEPIRPIDPIRPIYPIRPIPFRRCYPQHGNWYYDPLPRQKWPASTSTTFYVGCKVYRPRWSSCKGYCESSQNITTRIPPRYDNDCKCCKSYRYQVVRPYPRCWVISINGARPSVVFRVVRQRVEDYTYALVGRCGCQDCNRRLQGRPGPPAAPEEIDEDQIDRFPTPPEPEQGVEVDAVLRGLPEGRELF